MNTNPHEQDFSVKSLLQYSLLTLAFTSAIVFICQMSFQEFFFIDDAKNCSLGQFREIGRQILDLQLPIITTKMMHGGNLLVYLTAQIFSPITLIMALVTNFIEAPYISALIFAFINISTSFFFGGLIAKLFTKQLHIQLLISFLIATNSFIVFTSLSSWWAIAQAYTLFVVAVFFLIHFILEKGTRNFILLYFSILFVISTYNILGLLLLFFVLLLAAGFEFQKTHNISAFYPMLCLGIISALTALPIASEFAVVSDLFVRTGQLYNDNFQTPAFLQILLFFSPLYGDYILWYGGYKNIIANFGYSGAPLLYLLVFRRQITKNNTLLWIFIAATAFTIFCTQLPSHIYALASHTRMLPYVVFLEIIVAIAFFKNSEHVFTKKRAVTYTTLVFIAVAFSTFRNPHDKALLALNACFLIIMLAMPLIIYFIKKTHILLAGAFVCFVLSIINVGSFTERNLLPNPYFNPNKPAYEDATFLSILAPDIISFIGTHFLFHDIKSLNGYSSLENKILVNNIKTDHMHPLPATMPRIMRRDAKFQEYIINLYNVGYLAVKRRAADPHLKALDDAGFTRLQETPHSYLFQKKALNTTYISYVTPEIQYSVAPAENQKIDAIHISANPTGGSIIIAKLWWPGYTATLNGKTLPLTEYEGLIHIEVPPHVTGTVICEYWPSSWRVALPISALGVLLLIILIMFSKKLPWLAPVKRKPLGAVSK